MKIPALVFLLAVPFAASAMGQDFRPITRLTTRSEANNSILRLGLNYRFGQPGGPPRY